MKQDDWAEVAGLLEDAVRPRGEAGSAVAPAASVLVGRGPDILFEHSAGVGGRPGAETAADEATVFDVASLTKPLVCAALVLDLVAAGALALDANVADLLPDFGRGDERRRRVTIRHLLRHDSGLPAYQRYFERFDPVATSSGSADARRRLFEMAISEPLERAPGSAGVYSDIGFLVLGAIVETVAAARIDELAKARLFAVLGLGDAWFVDVVAGPSAELRRRAARTGYCEWRRREIHAEVQDENAYAMGGIASHAGLFATARAVHRLVAEWVEARSGRGLVLDPALVAESWDPAASARAPSAFSTWVLGWDTPTAGGSSAGTRIGAGAVGHLGYTGTSVWVDPQRAVHVVLLTNRIACGRNSDAIRAFRPRLHDAVFAAVDRARILPEAPGTSPGLNVRKNP